jgi:two-component system sensor histidine kinase KdpD
VLGLAGPIAMAAALAPARPDIDIASVLLLFLLTVLLAAAVGGFGPAVVAAVASFGLANWFFIPPLHTWEVEHLDNVLALLVFLAVGLVVSWYGASAGRRAAQAARAEAGTELRNALLAAVSHDLRTPLSSIKASATSLLADDVEWSREDIREFTATIDEETDRLTSIVTNLLDMSRLTTGALPVRKVEVRVDELVLAALDSLGERAAVSVVDVEVDEDLPSVQTDPSLVERAIANVVDNALAWSPPGRSVQVEARPTGTGAVRLLVVDHGPGIPAAERDLVFEPFRRRGDRSNGPGVGLGLAVARGLLGAVGASISAEDAPGGGTVMAIDLPIAPGLTR